MHHMPETVQARRVGPCGTSQRLCQARGDAQWAGAAGPCCAEGRSRAPRTCGVEGAGGAGRVSVGRSRARYGDGSQEQGTERMDGGAWVLSIHAQ